MLPRRLILFLAGGVLVLLSFTSVSAQTCNPTCGKEKYCFSTPADTSTGTPGITECRGCHPACTDCDGPGITQCSRCQPGFLLTGTACQECLEGSFGVNCTGECHCLPDTGGCSNVDGACRFFECEWGYKDPPLCQTECVNQYGKNCKFDCHCPVNDTCNVQNGQCASARCAEGFAGPGCQVELPRLRIPPTITGNECGNVTVTWQAWDESVDNGQGPIYNYQLLYRSDNVSDTAWYSLLNTPNGDTTTVTYTHSFTGLNPDSKYKFRVDVIGKDGTKPSSEKIVGFETDFYTMKCIVITTTTVKPLVTTIQPLLEAIFTDFDVSVNVTDISLYVNWTLMANHSVSLTNLTMLYRVSRVRNCGPDNLDSTFYAVSLLNNSDMIVPGLLPWRKYEYKVYVSISRGNLTESRTEQEQEFLTPAKVPTGVVLGLRVTSVSASAGSLAWNEPECENRNGMFMNYEISVRNLNNSVAAVLNYTRNLENFDLSNLTSFTVYNVSVSFVNEKGAGPPDSVFLTTLEAAPSAPEITSMTPAVSYIILTYDPPVTSNGVIREYVVFYSKQATFVDETRKSAKQATNITITGLEPATLYYFKVQARTGESRWGDNSQVGNTTTLPDKPSDLAHLAINDKNVSCLEVIWKPPTTPNGEIIQYKVKYQDMKNTTWSPEIILDVPVTSYVLCGLNPGRRYMIQVSAATAAGFGDPSIVFGTTVIGQPPKPTAPFFVNTTDTQITIILNQVVINTGPLKEYRLYAQDLTAKMSAPGYLIASFPAADITSPRLFVIGDGVPATNKPLTKDHEYVISLEIVSFLDEVTRNNINSMEPVRTKASQPVTGAVAATDTTNSTPIIVAVVVIVLLLLIAVLVVGLIFWYKRRQGRYVYQPQSNEKEPNNLIPMPEQDYYDPTKHWNTIHSTRESRYITSGRELLQGETEIMSNGSTASPNGGPPISFSQEFHDLPHGQLSSWNAAVMRKNANKNRFPHLLPYDHTRVVLNADENSNGDFINANYVHGYKKTEEYIAAQSPFNDETVLDFWRMIFQKNIKIVVMITNTVEDSIVKCTQYWPDTVQGSVHYGSFVLEIIETREFADYIIRTIKITTRHSSSHRFIHLFEFCTWPDHGVPSDSIPLLDMRNKVRDYRGNDRSPLLVHCGTGVSRTGTYIAIDALLEQYEAEGRISVFSFLRKLRKDRVAMVRTLKQYVFIYDAIFEERVAGDTRVGPDLKSRYHELTRKNPKTKHSYLKDQFICLQRYTRKVAPKKCHTALLPLNVVKNRFPDVVPPDDFRPVLEATSFGRTDYINAVFLDSHRRKNHFIVTQTPLHTTITDFWKLVYDLDINTIVMMESYKHEDDTCAEYWPDHKAKKFEPYFIDNTEDYQTENVTVRHFNVSSMQQPRSQPHKVRQFQFNAWEDPDFIPKSKSMLLDLVDMVTEWQKEENGDQAPILVHCKDGATHSGLFCAVVAICQAMNDDGDVDVFHTIKHMKRRRAQIVDMLDQYRFCYRILWDYMNLRMQGGTLTNMMSHSNNDPLYIPGSLSLASYTSHLEYI
ncbi:receptor-type tyrosine-protein phosphatase T-like isoform X2 [Mizuhopecten yessoensis]|uniref:protein-tyrosine-phosphatase n=1 Tax=Mizuhopecten yessoensis TaxID=6573 RepID=A0A210PLZ5_MIZYE|nr:receptor-type tyrosine-protein phosphatase T-like isoform X2 [Mizuhopecten yessoensis]OWF37446.1 Receptor-type tyrosine-protein phosphatase T [Mizuhopecten yessoensis]